MPELDTSVYYGEGSAPKISRRDFMKALVRLGGIAALAFVTQACSTELNSPPISEVGTPQGAMSEQVNNPDILVAWRQINDKDVNRGFKLADRDLQEWENVASVGSDNSIYTFQMAAELIQDPKSGEVVVALNRPFQEQFVFLHNTYLQEKFLQNSVGIDIPTNLDERYIKSATGNFPGSKVELLTSEIALVPNSIFDGGATIPRYLATDRIGVQFIKGITVGPLTLNGADVPETTGPKITNTSTDVEFWKNTSYILRVTGIDGIQKFFEAQPLSVQT